MASMSYLVDTDIVIDWLRGQPWARRLIWSDDVRTLIRSLLLPLLTRNHKHYAFIEEIDLVALALYDIPEPG